VLTLALAAFKEFEISIPFSGDATKSLLPINKEILTPVKSG